MSSDNTTTSQQTQSGTSTATPWSAATPLLQSLISGYGGMSGAMTPQQTAAGGQLQNYAQNQVNAAGNLGPLAQNVVNASGLATPYGYNVMGSAVPLTGAAANVLGSADALTPAAYQAMFGAQAQMPAAYNMMNAAQGVNALAPQSTQAVANQFGNAGMLQNAYGTTQANLNPLANTSAAALNPYTTPGFSDALNTLTQNITSQVGSQYAGSGRDPSGAGSYAQSLGRGLMQGEAPIIQSQYNTNLQNALSANQMLQNAGISTVGALGQNTSSALANAGLLPSLQMAPAEAQWTASQAPLAAAQSAYTAAGLPYQAAMTQYNAATQPLTAAQTQLQAAMTPEQVAQMQYQAGQTPLSAAQAQYGAAAVPWQTANAIQAQQFANMNPLLAAAMGLGGMGGTTTQQGQMSGSQTQETSALSNILGALTAAAGIAGKFSTSDERLKTDIKKVGKTRDDQNIYSYRFKGSNVPQIGMMAQEVEKKHPEAVMTDPATGYKKINYDAATRKASSMGMLSKMAA